MKAATLIRYLDVLGMSIGTPAPKKGRAWNDAERKAYYGLLRHLKSIKEREVVEGEPPHDHPWNA